MKLTKRFMIMLLCAALCAPLAQAQQKPNDQPDNPKALQVMIIIHEEKVRFIPMKAVQELHLQIFDQNGETVYDSGATGEPEINWTLQNASNEAISSGLYAYTLSLRESDAAAATVRRGHLIIDRVKDREGAGNRLWVTTQSDNGVGTELTFAKSEATTVAGTSGLKAKGGSRNTANLEAEEIPDGLLVRGLNGLTDQVTLEAGTNIAITPEGNNLKIDAAIGDGQLVKGLNGLTDQVTLEAGSNITITPNGNTLTIASTGGGGGGYSSITETNGNIGIGTTIPSGRLHIIGSADVAGTLRLQPDPSKGLNHSHVHWGPTGDWYIRSAAPTGKLVLQDVGGSVAIGAVNPVQSRLYVFNNNSNATVRAENSANGSGVVGSSSSNDGVFGSSSSGRGVHGLSSNSHGVFGESGSSVGVFGKSTQFEGVRGESSSAGSGGVVGYNLSTGIGVYGQSNNGIGMQARSTNGTGVDGGSTNGIGVYGISQGVNGFGGLFRNTAPGGVALKVEGKTRTGVLEITGGADFAENFDVNVAETTVEAITPTIEAGMVVSIDPVNPGKLALTTLAYDRRVAGIISGAGGVKPGMMMSQEGTLANGRYPVALSGRVYCWVDASQGAIEPGDLLTTSATPGHAMKVTDSAKAQGAIIGKAMTGLKSGKGLVLVLVTLQ
jgi:hypothetical protein